LFHEVLHVLGLLRQIHSFQEAQVVFFLYFYLSKPPVFEVFALVSSTQLPFYLRQLQIGNVELTTLNLTSEGGFLAAFNEWFSAQLQHPFGGFSEVFLRRLVLRDLALLEVIYQHSRHFEAGQPQKRGQVQLGGDHRFVQVQWLLPDQRQLLGVFIHFFFLQRILRTLVFVWVGFLKRHLKV